MSGQRTDGFSATREVSGFTPSYVTGDSVRKFYPPPSQTSLSNSEPVSGNPLSGFFAGPAARILAGLAFAGVRLLAVFVILVFFLSVQSPQAAAQGTPVSIQPAGNEEGLTITFTVTRTGDTSNALTVNYTTEPGQENRSYDHADSSDFTAKSGSLMFGAGDTAAKTIEVETTNDGDIEPKEEKFILRLSGTYDGKNFEKEVLGTILENDHATVTVKPDPFTITEGETGTLTFELSQALPYPLLVRIHDMRHETATKKAGDGGATEADYTFPDSFGELLIKANERSGTFDIPTKDDEIAEPDEKVELLFETYNRNLVGSSSRYHRLDFSKSNSFRLGATLTITDNDSPTSGERVVHLQGGTGMTQVTLTEGGSTNVRATVVGTAPSSDIKIPLKAMGYPSGEFAMGDYSIPEEITIKSGKKSGIARLTTKNNSKDDRYYRLVAVEIDDKNLPSGYTSGDRNRFEVVIKDNQKTNVSLQSPSRTSLSEDSSKNTPKDLRVEFKIQMDRPVTEPSSGTSPFVFDVNEPQPKFVLGFNTPGRGKASHGVDYRIPSTISPPGNCTQWDGRTCTVELMVRNDMLYEGNEKAVISLNTSTGVENRSDAFNGLKVTGGNLTLTIMDDDLQPMLSIGDAMVTEGNKLAFTVTRAGAKENALSVKAATADDGTATHSATAGSDYSAITRTLNFPKNELTQTFEVTTTEDIIDEMDETFLVKLSEPKDTQSLPPPGIADDEATGTITDDDDAPMALKITVDTDTDTDGDQGTIEEAAGATDVTVTATITSPTRFSTEQMVTITVGKEGDDAAEGTDYKNVPDNIKITIPAEQASGTATFKLTPVNDRLDENGETISVEGALTGMTVEHAVITIEDDDTRGITVTPVALTLDEANNKDTATEENKGTYEVVLTSEPTDTVTINVASDDEKIAAVDKKSLMFTKTNWEMPQTVTVTSINDPIDNTNDIRTTSIINTVSASETDYKDQTAEDVDVTVTDDDEAPTALTITVDKEKVGEGDEKPTVRITATLDGDTQFATAKNITITVGDSDKDTATEGTGGDYATVAEFDITLPAGESEVSHDLTLTINDDDVDEPDEETISVTGELSGVTVKGTTFAIEDNDTTPTVTLVLTPASINESGATNASTVTATMDADSSEAVTLTVSATPVDPVVAGDLTLSGNTTLEIPALSQASTGVVTITAVDNDVDATDKTVTVAATATGGNALVQAPGNETLTIKDDDTRGITVSKATLTLDEADNMATTDADEHQGTYTVVLNSEPSGGTVTIGVASGDTTVAGVAPATLTFDSSDWNEPQTVTVTTVADVIDNPMDRRTAAITHTVTATGTDYDGATASGVTVKVNDDDGAPTLSINSPSVTEVDSGATATLTFTVRLTPASGNTVTVAYADAGTGTATSGGTDYETFAGGTLTFAPSETSKSVAVTVNGDDIDESNETVVVRLSSPSNATLTGGATTLDGTGTINDNDATPTVSVADATAVFEGDVAAPDPPNNMTFAVTLSAASGLDVTVPYTLGGTATAGTDYTEPDPRSVTIAAGTTQVNIKIPVAGDEVDEENETITVTLGTPTNATVSTAEGAGAASGTITDDDTRGVSVTPTALTVAEADNTGTAATRENQETYKVVLTSQPTGAVTVNLKSDDESVARIDTARLVFDTDDWNTERTVTVTGQADVIDNTGNERTTTIAHTVSAAGTDYASETAENVAVTVTDDDAAPSGITLTASPDSVTENGGAKTITVTAAVNGATRYAEARTVSVSVGGGTAISGTDYTAVESFDITIGAGEDDASNTFTLTPENDVLAEGNETIDVTGTLSGITITPDEITLTDDDAVPSGITLSVDTNGAEDGTPSTVAEDAGATVVTVTATVNGDTRYVEAKTVAVSVADGTAESPADYAAVSNFNITIAAGAASHTGSFTVTPVDDDLDEPNETIDVTGTLSSITITGATVTFTDNDDPVSFSIADAEATEGGKVTFRVRRAGAGDNVASVKVTTATDSGDGADAADADDYTAIATAQTLNFAKGVASQTVEVQTTQDDLFEPDETFKAVLSAPALGENDPGTGVSIESGKGTATGTIKNDDTEPSFAVADASAVEGNGITFTVTRSGAKDNAVSVKWNTKPDTGAAAAVATDYTPVTTATTLSFAKGVSSQTFTVATTEDVLAEGNETFLVELTGAVGATISTAEATGTINDDDAAPSAITLSVDADTGTNNVQSSIAEEGGVKTVRVTATIGGTTRFATAQTVTVTVGKDGDSATEGTDYAMVDAQSIEIPIGAASAYVDFMITPTTDVLFEGSEIISMEGTLTGVTFTNTSITITDDDAAPTGITLSVDADTGTDNMQSSIAEEGGVKTVRVTATIGGTTRFATAQTVTVTVGKDGDSATEGMDYAMVDAQSIEIPIGAASAYVDFMLTPTTDVLFEGSETISLEGTLTGVTFTNSSITITDDDDAPSAITLSVDTNAGGDGTPTNVGEGATATTVRVTATITSATRFATEQTVKVKVGKDGDSATEGTDYALVADQNIKIPAGAESAYVDFPLTPTHDILDEPDETISVDGELTGVTFTAATITITDDDAAPQFITLAVDTNAGGNGTPTSVGEEAGATRVRVTATITSATRFAANQAVTFEVGKSADSATESTDYTEVGTLTITIDGGEASGYVDFTLTPTSDVLDEPNETISVHGTQANITFTDATITINDDDAAPTGITLSVDTNGAEDGTPSTVAEDAGATVVTVTATVNGTTRYVDDKTVAVSVDDDTAASPADYAAVSNFSITIAAGTASQTGVFTVTPVDDDLDEANETIDVTGTLTDITITPATVTLTDTDAPVSFSIADAEATEGGKVTFTVSRKGAEDNVASVKIATATDSGDDVNAADADDYTAIATAQTLNFAAGVTSQTVEVQTTQDDLFEPDETFRAVLSGEALAENDPGTGVSIESGKGTATGTINNDDTEPSFAVADASATEGDAITFTVTRSGAMDNTVSVKWNTKADSSDGANAASASDYAEMTTAQTLTFAKGVSMQTFSVATTEDTLDEDNETFLVELTGAVGATIATAEATGTINDDDAAPSGITLSVDTNGSTSGTPSTVAEDAGATVVTVTATVNGTTRYVDAKTVAVSVDDGTAASPGDYAAVSGFNITIAAGAASQTGVFTVTPVDDDLDESDETINVTGTLTDVTVTAATVTLTDTDDPVSFSIADAEATEGGKVTFTVSRKGAEDNVASVKIATATDSGDDINAADADDYTAIATAQTLNFAAGVTSQTVEVQTTQDDLFEPDETFRAVLSGEALAENDPGTGVSIESGKGTATGTINNDDTEPSFAVADASATEGDAITFTVTRSGAMDNAVSVKWNTKADSSDGANAASASDYAEMTTAQTLTFAKGVSMQTFSVATTEDTLDEDNETFLVELTGAVGATIATAEATGTINDDDAAPSGITLSVDTNGSTSGTPSTVAEDAGATVVTVTATVNGTTRYVDAKTVAVSVDDGTAASPGDYAAVSGFNITIAAGAASQTGVFTVTPVDDDLDESDETINVTGTLTDVTVTAATVTLTDTDDPVSFSIADAEATEGGKVTFTVSRKGAEDNVAEVKVATATDSGDDVNAADADDYTAIATAQRLNFAAGVTSQTVEVQTTQDDLFEPDETFKAVLSAPALGENDPGTGVSIEAGKGTATGTINNDDIQPSFAVADASASEGDAITFTVTRSGAMDNAVSVKWNTKAATGADAAATSDYTPVPTARTLTFVKGASSQTFTVATTEDTLHEGNETFLVELTDAVGATIATAEATGTINDDDDAPSGITLSVDTNGSTAGTPSTVAEDAGATVVTVTATVNGTTRYVDAKTVAVSVDDDTATSPADYAAVSGFNITIPAGAASHTGSFTVTPVDDDLDEANETINVTGTLTDITITDATVTLTDTDAPVSFSIADAEATEGGKVTFTVSRKGAEDNVAEVKVATATDSGDDVNAADADDYTAIAEAQTLNFAAGVTSQTVEVQTTQDDLFEPDETFKAVLSAPALGENDPGTGVSIEAGKGTATGTINNDDIQPSFAVADASASEGDAITFTVTRSGAMDNAVSVKWNTKAATGAGAAATSDYTPVPTARTLTFVKGASSQTFTVATTEDTLHEGNETFLVELTDAVGATIATAEATGTINDDDDAPSGITLSVDTNGSTSGTPSTVAEDAGATVVTVTATVNGTTRYVDAKTVAVSVDDDTATSPADYAAVSGFNITIPAGAASHTGSFTVTPVDDDLDEANETIDVTGTLTDITITDATVTLTDTDAPVSFSIADAEATEGGKVTFTVSRKGAEDNVASVKIATATDSGADANAADADDYTAITEAQTLNFAAGVTSQTVEVQTTQDDLFEPDETFKAVLSAPALGENDPGTGVSIEAGKGTATGTINNDDIQPSFAVADASASEGDAITFTVTRSGAMDNAVSVKWNTKAATGADAAATSDYTPVPTARTLTFVKGASSQTFTVATTEDTLHEGNETFLVELTDAVGATIATAEATGTINDDDDAPTTLTLSVDADTGTNNVQTSLAEDGGAKTVRVTATLGGSSTFTEAKTVTVEVGADADSAEEGTDYTTVAQQSITINAGSSSGYVDFTLTPTDDDIDEPNEGISIEGMLTGVTVTGTALTITDDEGTPTVTLVLTPSTINESGETNVSTVTATLSGKSNEAVTLTVAATAGADTAAGDFTLAGTTLTIAAGATTSTGTVTITAMDNDVDAPNKTVTVSAAASGGGVADPDSKTLTINDDEGVPTATLVLTPTAIDESGDDNSTTVTATLSGKSNEAVTLTVAATAGADTDAGDFTLSMNKTLTIAAGATTSTGTVTITAMDNDIDAPNKTVTVSAAASGGGVADPDSKTLTINDDEGVPTATLVLTPTAIDESGDDNSTTVTATLSGKSNEAVTLTVAAAAGADTVAADFTLSVNKTLTIAAGATTSTGIVTIEAEDNDVDAPNKTVTVSATATGGGVAAPAPKTLTINDDEGVPTATLVLTPTAIDESGDDNSTTVTATLSGKSNEAVTLTVAATAGADTAAGDFTLAGTTLTIAAGATTSTGTVTITAMDNDVDAPNKTVTVSAAASGGGVADPDSKTLTINDDEGVPTATLVLTPTAIDESGDDNSTTVTATLSGKSNEAVTLTVAATAGADTDAGDFTLSMNKTLTIAAGATTSTGTVTITAMDNDIDAPNKTVTVSAAASGGGVADPDSKTLTINDDEGVPTATLVLTPTAIDESGDDNSTTVTATLSGKSNEAVTLTVAAAAGADTVAADFSLTGTTLTIAKGATTSTGTVTITAVDNDVDAPNKTVTVSAAASGGNVANPDNQTLTINDDEGTPTVTLELGSSSINESGDGNSTTVTATLSGKSNVAVTLTVDAAAGADTVAGDFSLTGTTLTIAKGATTSTGTVTITAVDNDVDAPNKTVTVSATASGGNVANPDNQTLTITDDEGTPTVTLVLTPTTINESGGTNASTVTATLSGKSNVAVTLTVDAAAGADTVAGDFSLTGTTLTIAKGATTSTGTVTITAVDNDIDAPNKTVTVSATASGGNVANPDNQTLTITDDEGTPTVTLVLTPTTINESGGTNASTVTATLSGKSNVAVTLTVDAAAGADTVAGDFSLTGTTLTIAKGATTSTGTVTITAVDNDVDAPNKTVTVSATASGGNVANPDNQTLTITDDEGTPTVTLVLTPTTINESGGTNASTVTATLSGKSNVAVTLTVDAAAGADTVAGDFSLTGTTLTIAKGATTSTGTVTITAVDNDVDAPNKTVTVSATASGGNVANPDNQTLTITDDEGTPTVTLVLTPTTINESGGTNASTVTATLSGKSNVAVTLTVDAAAGADTVAGDFSLTGTTLTIAKGATTSTGTVTITAVDNDVDAPNKTVTVSATASGGNVANPDNQTLTITDDEGTPTVTLVLTPTTINESGGTNASTVTATLSGKSNVAVTLTVDAAAGADTVAGDFSLTGTTLTIAKGATTSTGTVTITAVDNDVDAPNKTVTVSATASGGNVANPDNQTLTITDDEGTPTVTLVLTPTTINESGGTNASTVTATLSGKSNVAVTLTVDAAAGADTVAGDFSLTGTTLTIAKGATTSTGTVTITAVDNDVDAPNKTVTVSATASGGNVANPDNQTLTITDDEGTPTVTLVLTPTTINESGGTNASTVTATLSGKSNVAVTLTVDAAAGADTVAGDFSLTGTTLTIAKGATTSTGTVTITAVDNDVDAPNKTVTVSATASGGNVANPDNQTLTITDDEGTPTVTLVLTPTTINESGGTNASTVTATLSGKSNVAVTLTVDAAAGADTVAGDFSLTGTTLTIAKGTTTSTGTVTITAVDNDVNAPDKTVTVSATADGGGVADPASKTLTIEDDDTTPPTALTITVDTDSDTGGNQNSIGENAVPTEVTVTATLDGTSRFGVNKDVTVKIGKDSDTAEEGTDYEEVGDLTVRINAGAANGSKTFTLTLTDDGIDEQDETISVEGTLAGLTVKHDSITITDDDEAPSGLTITVDTDPVKEGNQDSVDEDAVDGTTVNVTATLNGTTSFDDDKTVKVTIGKDSDTAKKGEDYRTGSKTKTVDDLTFTLKAGKASASETFRLTPINDGIDEEDETISVEGTLAGLTVTHDSITITDDDEAPSGITLTVDPASVGEEDGETEVTVTATLDGTSRFGVNQTVTVTVGAGSDTTEEGRAISGTDYTAVPDFDITINAGEASGSNTFTLTPKNDDLAEGNETISVTGTLGSLDPAKATIIINDNDAAPTGLRISVDTGSAENLGSSLSSERDGSLLYENSGTTKVTVTATLDGTSRFGVDKTVAVSVVGGTAIPGTDYTAVSNFDITIVAGAKSGTYTFDITPIDDALAEGDETINLEGTLTGITVTGTTITITDDDTAPTGITLTVDPASVGEENGEPEITVTAAVNGATRYTDAKTVTVSVGGGTATSGTDYREVPGFNITIGAGAESATHTFTLILIDDKIHEGDETINVTGISDSITVTDATLTIEDDEELPVVSINSPSVKESGKSGVPTEMTFTVTIFPESTNLVTVSYADAGTGTATADKDYVSPGTGILTFAPGTTRRRIAITVKGDDIDEYDETVVLRLSNPTNATLPGDVATLESAGTIIDNNEPPTVSLLDSEPVEEGEVAVFPVHLSGESGKTITVRWKTSSGTALEDIDYHGGTGQITIPAGTIEETIEIATIDDREIEDWTETFSIALSDTVNVTPDSIEATGTIEDDDRPAAIERLERVNKTILPYVGSAIMRSRIDHVTGCIKHAASGVAYGDLSSLEGQLRNNADILEQHQMERISLLEVFNDARFASEFRAYEEKHNPGDVTFCAGGDWNELSGGDDDPVTWNGSLAGTHLGGNVRLSEWILTGLDLFIYTGSFDWTDEGGEEEFRGIEGEWNLNIRGVNPYVALLSEDGETQFWTMAGYGFGRVDIEEEILDQSADITMKSIALGGKVPLTKISGKISLSLRGDLWLGQFEIADNADLIKGVSVQTRGARALLESTWKEGSITPSLLVGVKHDNSFSDSTGMEVGSGIEWGPGSHGIRVSLKNRALLVRSGVQEWGISGEVLLSPRDRLGPSLRLKTSSGDAEERATTFLENDSETSLSEGGNEGVSFEAEAGWGIKAINGRGIMTPFAGVSLLERDESILRLGGRLDVDKTLDLQLEGQRENSSINGPEYGLLLEAKFSF